MLHSADEVSRWRECGLILSRLQPTSVLSEEPGLLRWFAEDWRLGSLDTTSHYQLCYQSSPAQPCHPHCHCSCVYIKDPI